MNYTLESLTTASECDALIAEVTAAKRGFERLKAKTSREINTFGTLAITLPQELNGTSVLLQGFTADLQDMAEGSWRNTLIIKVNKLENEERALIEKMNAYGPKALLTSQNEVANLDIQITEATTFIAAIETHKATL